MAETYKFWNTDLSPNTDLQLDLGRSAARWSRLYALNGSFGGIDWVWPTSDGSANDVLTTDGAGTLSLAAPRASFVSVAKWGGLTL